MTGFRGRLALLALPVAALTWACAVTSGDQLADDKTGATTQPNIVLIIADDLGYADISAYGGKRVATPNIDRIARTGVAFTDAYSAAPVCAPARAGLMTGRYPPRFGFEFNYIREQAPYPLMGLDTNEILLAQELKGAGYSTGLVGKWHQGDEEQFYPMNRGFDEFVGFLPGATSYIDPTVPGVHSVKPPGAFMAMERDEDGQIIEGKDRKVIRNEKTYLTEYLGERSVDFIKRHTPDDKPYFLHLAFNAPHDPLQVTQKYYDRFPQIKDETLRIYAGMIAALDDQVGAVLDAIDASGEGDNTIIYFVSDNGCAGYIEGLCACEPLRGGKLTHYEGGMRVPFLMRWPSKVRAGQVSHEIVSTMDVFTSSLVAAGGKLRTDRVYDGVDLLPFLTGQDKGRPHEALMWRRQPMASVRAGDWKLWKSTDGKFTLLFNLAKDPNETTNLADKEPAKLKELEAMYEEWAKSLMDPKWPSIRTRNFSVCGTPFEVPI